MRIIFCALALVLLAPAARAAEADLYCLTGTKADGSPNWQPAASGAPCPMSGTVAVTPGTMTPSAQLGGVIGTGNTFQTVIAANPARTDCLLQNTSTHTGYVYWLASGSPSLTNTLQLSAGSTFYCHNNNGQLIKTAIQYTTSTTNDPFVYGENQ